MNCKHCDNKLANDAKFCGKCGKSVSDQNLNSNNTSQLSVESKKITSATEMTKKVLKTILVIFFMMMTSAVSSAQRTAGDGWMGDIYNVLIIICGVTSFALLSKWWKNRKTGKKWFNWRWVTLLIVLSVLGFSAQVFSRALVVAREKAMQNPELKAEYINKVVEAVRTKMSFPSQINDSTSVTDITAERNAVRYHYLLSDVDTSNLSNESLKDSLVSSICQSEDTKGLFDKGIDLEFLYAIKNSPQSYLVQFTKLDCQK